MAAFFNFSDLLGPLLTDLLGPAENWLFNRALKIPAAKAPSVDAALQVPAGTSQALLDSTGAAGLSVLTAALLHVTGATTTNTAPASAVINAPPPVSSQATSIENVATPSSDTPGSANPNL